MKVLKFAKDENMQIFLTTANLSLVSYDQKCWHFSDHTKFHSVLGDTISVIMTLSLGPPRGLPPPLSVMAKVADSHPMPPQRFWWLQRFFTTPTDVVNTLLWGRTKWPATYTRYFALGMQLSPCTPVTVFFPLIGCGYARKKNNKTKIKLRKLKKYHAILKGDLTFAFII